MAAAAAARAGHAVPRPPGAAVLPALRHRAVEPRAGAGLRGGPGPSRSTSRSRWPTAAGASCVVWTTTPWTLPSNVAVAVHPELEYGEYRVRRPHAHPGDVARRDSRLLDKRTRRAWRRARARVRTLSRARAGRGSATSGRSTSCRCPADGKHGSWSPGDFVTADDGSGLVHMAPAFGADDYAAGQEHGLALVRPVAADGTFHGTTWPEIEGKLVTAEETNDLIIRRLKARRAAGSATRAVRAHLSALLALQEQADLLRPRLVVRAHLGGEGADARDQRAGATGIRPRSGRAGSASGWRTTSTGRSRATATGARRCRCGSAIAIPTHVEVIGSYAELAAKVGPAAAGGLRSAQAVHRRVHLACAGRRHDAPRRPR